jgi:hypothetical protein
MPVKGLDDLDRLLELASPRPWIVVGDDEDCALEAEGDVVGAFSTNTDDAALAAAAVNALPALLRAYRAGGQLIAGALNTTSLQEWARASAEVEQVL